MSTDNHDQTEPCVSKPSVRIEFNADEKAFDGRRIKKERNDVTVENGDGSINICISDNNKQVHEESKTRIQNIFSQIEQLKVEEKLLLYLKLPLSLTNTGGTIDPLRQPLNPLGNRYEIHQTIMWIKTHLEEDPDVSLPKQEVYDEYNMYCMRNSMKPLSTADFGKVMKQVYPRVRPRRLGTRGNSRYCYAGMRKRVKLDSPTLPNITGTQTGDDLDENITEEMLGATSTLIREWAENLLGLKFPSLSALARHLVDNLCVDTRSLAAVCILCASGDSNTSTNKESSMDLHETPLTTKPGKLREAQLQLQRKLQQREQIRHQKHDHFDAVIQNQNKEKTVDNKCGGNKGNKKIKSTQSSQGTNISGGHNTSTKFNLSAVVTNRQRRVLKTNSQPCNISLESNCDNVVVQSIEDIQNNSNSSVVMTNCVNTQRDVKPKNSRKRANPIILSQPSDTSPEKQTKLTEQQTQQNVEHSNMLLPKLTSIRHQDEKISVILAGNLKPTKCNVSEVVSNQPIKNCDIELSACSKSGVKVNGRPNSFDPSSNTIEESTGLTKDQIRLLQENSNLLSKTEKLRSVNSDTLDDYLNGGNNSQEQEEELLQYFQQSSSSSSDVEANTLTTDEQISRSDKVSQLRLILQQNLKSGIVHAPLDALPSAIIRQNVEKRENTQKHNLILPTLLNHSNQSNTRRRVSFETNVVEHVQDSNVIMNTVPQSPNTRRRIFNFTPISPGPHSPINGRTSKSNSANASPFVSPRNTPVPRSRSNLQASSSRARAHKSLSRSVSCSMPYTSKNDTFVVPTSGPELVRQTSTPQMPLISTKSSEVQVGGSTTQISVTSKREGQGSQCAAFLSSDLAPQKQLLINYPSQENLQEIKNVYQKCQPDQEISELFHANKQFTNELYRSQSVPLHRMVNPTLMSPISTQHCLSTFQSQSFNPSTNSSIAPTPVPSEFNDFGSIGPSEGTSTYLLDDVDPNFMSDDQHFLMSDKEITPENITNILNILDEEGAQSLQILPEQSAEESLIENNGIVLDSLPNSNLNLSEEDVLDPSNVHDIPVDGALQKIIQSRSYPNTPLPVPVSTYTPSYTEDSNGSRSYPSTPLHIVPSQEIYQEANEPMLSSPTLNSLNLHNETVNESASGSLCRNVVDLLEANFLGETDTETNDLDPLGNFDGLQDVDSLTPLFNEVTEPNR
ncbi:DNA-binding protein RFX7 [Dufourea novaeangliae]|uniref:DNA-binding protein RFX7 n=1 Tax=Dufourea novaeangliae TaxID=178035 RepID=A0A154PIC6_DUFNO|nr:DNA-binding protein RFX7 [Dufourea novaeangliae]